MNTMGHPPNGSLPLRSIFSNRERATERQRASWFVVQRFRLIDRKRNSRGMCRSLLITHGNEQVPWVRFCVAPSADRLESHGKASWLDGKKGRLCRNCKATLAPRRNRLVLAITALAGLAVAGTCLALTFAGFHAEGWMPFGIGVGFVVTLASSAAVFSKMPVYR
jgi:hypothetical protein